MSYQIGDSDRPLNVTVYDDPGLGFSVADLNSQSSDSYPVAEGESILVRAILKEEAQTDLTIPITVEEVDVDTYWVPGSSR